MGKLNGTIAAVGKAGSTLLPAKVPVAVHRSASTLHISVSIFSFRFLSSVSVVLHSARSFKLLQSI